jgi:electron transport complex protein RnfB
VMCIKACPVEAIVGAAKLMHTVVPELCTGCGLCVEPCPVDCISMKATAPQIPGPDWRWAEYSPEQTGAARKATEARLIRIAKRAGARSSEKRLRELRRSQGREHIRQEIRVAVARQHAARENKQSKT